MSKHKNKNSDIRQNPHAEKPTVPSDAEIAKNNVLQTMNTVGSVANNFLQSHVRANGIAHLDEQAVDAAIAAAQSFVFKVNELTKQELDAIDSSAGPAED